MKSRNLCVGLMLSIVLIAAIGLSMIACGDADPVDIPSDYTTTVIPGSLPAFTLNTAVHPGGVLLTWDLVKDASSYEVWRQAPGGANVRLGTVATSASTQFADIKSRLNDLKAGINYKYTVLAISSTSTRAGAAPVIVQNSKAEKTVNIPAANLEVTLTPVTNLRLTVTPSSNVLATWDADTNPLVSYELYNRQDTYPNPRTVDTPFYAYTLSGGTVADVIVRKVLYKSTGTGDFAYYSPSEDANAAITVFNMSNATVGASRDSNALVKLTVSNISPDTGLASFDLFRYKYAASIAETPTWESVSLASARLAIDIYDGTYYEVYDTLPANSENSTFVYRLVGKYPGVNLLRNVAYSNVVGPLYTVQELADITYEEQINETYPGTPSTSVDDLEAFFLANHSVESEVAYTYFLKQTSYSNGIAIPTLNPTVEYDWVDITQSLTVVSQSAPGKTVKVTLPEARTTYSFKIVATGTGSKAGYIGKEKESTGIYLRDSILSGTDNYNDAGYFIVTEGNGYDHRGTQYNGGTLQRTVYSLNLSGLAGVVALGETGMLRANETLSIELVSLNGAAQQAPQNVTRTTGTDIDASGNSSSIDGGALDYFFTIPEVPENVPGGAYEVRLYVTAK